MNNAELIAALRECEYCNVCSIAVDGDCPFGGRDALEVAAADALEAAERLLDQNTKRCEALRKQLREAHESYEKHINELEAQITKEGKWEQHIFDGIMGQRPTAWICTMCNCLSVYKTDYCPNCGAKMNHKYCDVVNGCVMCDVELCNGKEKQESER